MTQELEKQSREQLKQKFQEDDEEIIDKFLRKDVSRRMN